MDKFSARTFRLLIVTVVVCILFVVCLPFAYRNVPKNNIREYKPSYETNTTIDDDYRNNTETIAPTKRNDIRELNVTDEDQIRTEIPRREEKEIIRENSSEEQDIFNKAMSLKMEGSYESAVYEYEKIAKNSDDEKIQAKCYEEIARTYASIKRYGSALSYAQKAFNLVPNSDREVLLARLYYKTGNSEKANERMNAVLKRDFDE